MRSFAKTGFMRDVEQRAKFPRAKGAFANSRHSKPTLLTALQDFMRQKNSPFNIAPLSRIAWIVTLNPAIFYRADMFQQSSPSAYAG